MNLFSYVKRINSGHRYIYLKRALSLQYLKILFKRKYLGFIKVNVRH